MKYILLFVIAVMLVGSVYSSSKCYLIEEMYDRDETTYYTVNQTDSISFYYNDGPSCNITIVMNYKHNKVYLSDSVGYDNFDSRYNGTYTFEDESLLNTQYFTCRFKFPVIPDKTVYSPTGNTWNNERLLCNMHNDRFNNKLSDMNNITISVMNEMYITSGLAITAYGGSTRPTRVTWCGSVY